MIYARVRLGKYLSERYEVACGGRLVAGGGIFSGQEFVGMRGVLLGFDRACGVEALLRLFCGADCVRASPAFSK